jgi:tetratricopeptide (TPR) repeat protein
MKLKIFSIIFSIFFIAGCHSTGNQADEQPLNNHEDGTFVLFPDSLWTPTGDAKLDSLLQLAATTPPDTNLAMLYYNIGDKYEDNDFEEAKKYYLKMNALNEQLDWNQGRYWFTIGYALILSRQGLADSAIAVNLRTLELARKEKNK